MQSLLQEADSGLLDRWKKLTLAYTHTQGMPELRERIAGMYPSTGAEQVLTLAPEEGIYIAMTTLLSEGQEVIVTFPAYQSLYEIALQKKCRLSYWIPEESPEGWHFNVEQLKQLISEKTRLLVVNFPHNPTGAMPSRGEWQEIIATAAKHDCILFSDDMYRGLEYREQDRLPSAFQQWEKSIHLWGLSKSFSLPGLRLGWLVCPNEKWLRRFQEYKDYTTICCSAPSEILGMMALEKKEALWKKNIEIIRNNLEAFSRFCSRYPGLFSWYTPKAGSLIFSRLHSKHTATEFSRALMEEEDTMLVPGQAMYFPDHYVRLGLGRTSFTGALERLEHFVQNNPVRSIR